MYGRSAFFCPFCRRETGGPHEFCGGGFVDTEHPSMVRPILMDLDRNGELLSGSEKRFAEAVARYG